MRSALAVQRTVFCLSALTILATLPAVAGVVDESKLYPLNTCPVSGQTLGSKGEPVVKEYDGREVRFCCPACPPTFEAKKDEYFKKIDEKIVEQQKDLYPIDTCLVTGEKLNAMDKPVEYVYNNRLIRFCCPGCVESFKKDADKYLAKLDEAVVNKQKSDYPLDTCVACGQKLDDKAIDAVIGGRLVRVDNEKCLKAVEKDPQKYLQKLDETKKAK